MRRLLVIAPEGATDDVASVLTRCSDAPVERWWAEADERRVGVLLAHVQNRRVESVVRALGDHPDVQVSLQPRGEVLVDPSDPTAIDERVADVGFRSPLEVIVSSRQSTGSWAGFLGYSAASGILSWIGLYTGTVYLLVAAMLVAPFAEPAMNVAIATARGLPRAFGPSLGRYLMGVAVSVATASALTALFGLDAAPELMAQVSSLSRGAWILPVVAGAAGALNLSQSERANLVSGAGTGMLIAAALAPPAAVVGIALVVGAPSMAWPALYQLVLQLAGINVGAALVFRLVGLRAREGPYAGGHGWVPPVAGLASVAALVGLVAAQVAATPLLDRQSIAAEAAQHVSTTLSDDPAVRLLDVEARFSPVRGRDDVLVVTGVVEGGGDAADAAARLVERQLAERWPRVRPVVTFQATPPR